ncbi:MAG: DUF488 family protein [Bacteroidia bacterium]
MKIKRVYEKPERDDGYRILVDRLWRDISKASAEIDEWIKEIAPSTELRKWFNHELKNFLNLKNDIKKNSKHTLQNLRKIHKISQKKKITLLYSAKTHSTNQQAVVLLEVLQKFK